MNKENMAYASTGMLFSYKKEEKPAIYTTQTDCKSIMLHEISQPVEEKYCMVSFICGI